MRLLTTVCLVLAALSFGLMAHAQAAAPTSALTWAAPTTNTDTTAITGAITYNVYEAATTAALSGSVAFSTGLTATTLTTSQGAADGVTACFAVTAVVGGIESAQSNAVCKTFPAAVPNAPSGLVVK